MKLVYSIGIYLYHILLICVSPFNNKAKKMISGRKNWKQRLSSSICENDVYVWFHCSSLGEFEQGRPLIEAFKKAYPNKKIVLTFFSPSGYDVRKNYALADIIMYLPFDTKGNARFLIETIKPEKVFFVKYDFWYHILNTLKQKEIDTYLVSAIFREKQVFFKPYGKWYRKVLHTFTLIFVQDEASKTRLNAVNIKHCIVAGDTRFDRVGMLPNTPYKDPIIDNFCKEHSTIVFGSTWPADENLIAEYSQTLIEKGLKLIIAPHEIEDKHIKQIESLFSASSLRYSKASEQELINGKVLIIDTIGKLSYVYRFGKIAYIGGGFGVGIHNTLEAAVYGIPIVFGPNYSRFKEACDLIKHKAAFPISDQLSFNNTFNNLLTDRNLHQNASTNSKQYVESMLGATQHIINNL